MWNRVSKFIDDNNLLNINDLYIVALSGGADSVTLLLMLHEAGYRIHAAHCNFRLRGAESDRDEAFCVSLCEQLGIELHRVHFDTKAYADLHKVSIEMAARELRYGWFAQLNKDLGAGGVCVAHHRDDSVETVLLNLVRSTGLRGLTGIRPKNHTKGQTPCVILRPLLCLSREDIEAYLTEKGQDYVTDSTNLEDDVVRNKIRLNVLPLLRELNPAVSENIQRTAEYLVEAQKVLDVVLESYNESNILNLNDLSKLGSSEYIIFEWLKNYGFNGNQTGQIMHAATGSIFSSPTGYDLLIDRHRLIVEPSLKPLKKILIPEEGKYIIGENAFRVCKCIPYISKKTDVATLDASKVCFPLTVRRVEEGDRMVPFGMQGSKLLSDMMTDLKMTLFEKRRQLVVVDAREIILWAVGLRTDQRVAVSEKTTEVLEIVFS
jgi:tRNA(Ile)-lysidine synthase